MIYSPVVERMEMDSGAKVIVRDPEILGGIPVFRGTRVPFKNLLDYLQGSHTLDEFLEEFPSVTRQAAIAALEHAKELVIARHDETSHRRVLAGRVETASSRTHVPNCPGNGLVRQKEW
jgi:uncharacterized protein (DUF433 family)